MEKMGRFYRALWLFFIAAMGLWGCVGPPDNRPGRGAVNAAEAQKSTAGELNELKSETLKIGVSIYRYDDDFMKLYRSELKKYLEETFHAEVLMRDAKDDQVEQDRQIAGFLRDGCDALIINPVKAASVPETVNLCAAAETPVVFINREPEEAEMKRWSDKGIRASYVGTDSKQAGSYQGEIILEMPDRGDINGDGVISYAMIMGEPENSDAKNRTEYSIRALKDGGMKTECLFEQRGNWERERGKILAGRALNRYKDRLEVIFCNNDAMANGALEAVEAAGRSAGRDLYLVGVDALEETVKHVLEGKIAGTVLNDHVGQSHRAADVVIGMIKGEKVETVYKVDYVKITTVQTIE